MYSTDELMLDNKGFNYSDNEQILLLTLQKGSNAKTKNYRTQKIVKQIQLQAGMLGRKALIEPTTVKNKIIPGPVVSTTEFFASITQSIQSTNPWHIPCSVNSTCGEHSG